VRGTLLNEQLYLDWSPTGGNSCGLRWLRYVAIFWQLSEIRSRLWL